MTKPLQRSEGDDSGGGTPLGSWPRMYGFVLAVLVVDIVLLTVFTRYFS